MNSTFFLKGLLVLLPAFFNFAYAKSSLDFAPLGSLNKKESVSLYSAGQQKHSFDACVEQFPNRRPIDLRQVPSSLKPLALCSDSFAVLYSQTSKTPIVVVQRLNAAQLLDAKDEERTNQFYPDPRIPKSGRAELSDYKGADPAVDRGHQFPAADSPTPNSMAQSFALSNMIPQDPKSNRGAWSKIEADVRKFTKRAPGNVFVFTGPIFDQGHETIGSNKVWKPTRIFKLVYDETSARAWAYIQPNTEGGISRPVDYATFVSATGFRLLEGVPIKGSIARP